jgi:hypothetical protein
MQQMRTNWDTKAEPGDEGVSPEKPLLLRKMASVLYGDPPDLPRVMKDSGLPIAILRDLLGVDVPASRVLEFKKG